jgi:hypothetical protein
LDIPHVASPIRCKQTAFDITMEAAMRPIRNPRDVSMLYRIEMNVIDVTFKIRVVTNGVLPVAALPDAFFSFRNFTRGSRM